MILGDPALAVQQAQHERHVAIDEIFRHVAARHPGALALIDAPNRETFTDGRPLRLTFAEADRLVWAIAGRLRRMGLPTNSVVGIQMPNTVENVLTLLGVLRAGLIAAPLPLLWRRSEAGAALTRVGAKALITSARAGGFDYAQLAVYVAADVFSIRYVCGFGPDLPDGVVAFDDLFTAAKLDPVPTLERDRQGNAVAHVAVVTFDVDEDGPVPVARSHLELLAGGLCPLEGRLEPDASILSTISPASFSGICLTLLPWLFAGGTLVLQHPFDATVFAKTRRDERCGTLVLPAPIAIRLAEAGLFAARDRPPCSRHGVRRSSSPAAATGPSTMPFSSTWRFSARPGCLRRAAVRAAKRRRYRSLRGKHRATVQARSRSPNRADESGTVAIRGPMVPHHAFPPGVEQSDQPHFAVGRGGLVDTGYGCRIDDVTKTMVVTSAPAGIVSVGGYRFALCSLLEAIGRIDGRATLAAIPDALAGQRLVGKAADRGAVRSALEAAGVNPIVAGAFADPSECNLRQAAGGG